MKFKNIAIILSLAALIFSGCEKLETINENPNQPESVSSDVLFTATARSSVNSMVNASFLLGNNIAQLTAKTLRTEVDVYSWNAFPTVWESLYGSIANISEAERIATKNGNKAMQGASLVMKSWMFSVLTLAYGDIPYTEAINGTSQDNWFPAYDKQEDVLNGLLEDLQRADELLASGEGSIGGDIIFEGETQKWRKFANALQLRLLMQLSLKQDVSSDIADIVANKPLPESNADNAVLVYTGTYPNEFPLLPLKQGDFDAVVISNHAVSVMEENDDPRLSKYARPFNVDSIVENPETEIEATYKGGVNGLETGGCEKNGSRLGYAYYDYPGHPLAAKKANGIILTYAEVELILAEAAHRGWITSDAETHYRNGLQASMDYYGVEFPNIDEYDDFSDYYNNSGIAYSGSSDSGLSDIREQKWLAVFFHGLEPFFEVRRWMAEEEYDWTAFEFLAPPCENTNNDEMPVRFLYPGNEQSLNPDNYATAVESLGSNSQNAKFWLLK